MSVSDRGSAPVEFMAFGIPSLLVTVIASQVVYGGYLSTVAFDAAAEGAAVAAWADGSPEAAESRVLEVVSAVTGVGLASVTVDSQGKTSSVTVTLDAPMLLVGTGRITQIAQAVNEPR